MDRCEFAQLLPSVAVFRNFRNTDASACSPLLKGFCRCSLTVRTSTSNSAASSFCVSHTVSSSTRTLMPSSPPAG